MPPFPLVFPLTGLSESERDRLLPTRPLLLESCRRDLDTGERDLLERPELSLDLDLLLLENLPRDRDTGE